MFWVISYDYNENKKYHHYCSDDNTKDYFNFIIKNKGKDEKQLIESEGDGNIRIWNFHSGEF